MTYQRLPDPEVAHGLYRGGVAPSKLFRLLDVDLRTRPRGIFGEGAPRRVYECRQCRAVILDEYDGLPGGVLSVHAALHERADDLAREVAHLKETVGALEAGFRRRGVTS